MNLLVYLFGLQVADICLIHDPNAGFLPYFPMELTVSHIHSNDLLRPPLQQAVCESTGGCTHIEQDLTFQVHSELVKGRLKF